MVWLPDPGIGYLQVRGFPYDGDYFDKYAGYAKTELGEALNTARLAMVNRWARDHQVVDVGIGSGQFVESRGGAATLGFDVNPVGVKWLKARGKYRNPALGDPVDAVTFWDSFEHIADPAEILNNVTSWVFVSIPIFRDVLHVLSSKHFRPDEHCWYFTEAGFIRFMYDHGWDLMERSRMESDLGREDIGTFAFARR